MKSEIPEILKRYGFRLEKILDDEKFTILDCELPDLCADRLDYFLRDPLIPTDFDRKFIYDNVRKMTNSIVFTDQKAAFAFSDLYLKMNHVFWARPFDEVLYFLMTDIFKIGFQKGFIKKEDLFSTEKEFLKKLEAAKDNDVKEKLFLIENLKVKDIITSSKEFDCSYFVKSKFRIIDPKVLTDRGARALSEINVGYKKIKKDFEDGLQKEKWIGYEV